MDASTIAPVISSSSSLYTSPEKMVSPGLVMILRICSSGVAEHTEKEGKSRRRNRRQKDAHTKPAPSYASRRIILTSSGNSSPLRKSCNCSTLNPRSTPRSAASAAAWRGILFHAEARRCRVCVFKEASSLVILRDSPTPHESLSQCLIESTHRSGRESHQTRDTRETMRVAKP
jgi:hypothetical protein